jgi:hypothetical protein
LIEQILEDLRLTDDNVKVKDTPAKSSEILNAGLNSNDFDNSFNYRSIIGKLELPRARYKKRYSIYSAPMCEIYFMSKTAACICDKVVRTIPKSNQK